MDGLISRLVEHGGQPVGATIVRDPFGHLWTVTSVEPAAKEFYGSVFGWRFEPGRLARAWGGLTAECADNQGIQYWLWQRA